ncbi:DUF4268 domain-containing protein [Mycolicibacterium peregrinum]|uniref:DUF4268 domain-containing protein n=1 Tax=Mycolicibacterium peregrinum TaxID=43304 RepID=UPI003AB00383
MEPNDWGKRVKAAADASGHTGLSRLYSEFWRQFLDRIATEHPSWTRAKASSTSSWYDLSTGISGIVYATAFRRNTGLTVLLDFQGPDKAVNERRFAALQGVASEFEAALGIPAVWDERIDAKSAAVYLSSEFSSVTDEDQWPAMLDWLLDRHGRFRTAFEAARGLGVFV